MSKDEKKVAITETDLKERFKEQIGLMGRANARIQQLQNEMVQTQTLATKANGAAESAINMLAEIIGEEEAKKFAQEILQPENNNKQETETEIKKGEKK